MLTRPEKLSLRAIEAMDRATRGAQELAIADVTLYELAQGIFRKRMLVHCPLGDFIEQIEGMFEVVPLTAAIAEAAAKMPEGFPRDPFDRIIAATALVHRAPLVTADGPIRQSGAVATIW